MRENNKLIILNLGSTSFKCKLFSFAADFVQLAVCEVSGIGRSDGIFSAYMREVESESAFECPNHTEAFEYCVEQLVKAGCIDRFSEIDAVGYKAVHGGRISGTQYVNDQLLAEMKGAACFAPAHNPIYISLIQTLRQRYPQLTQIVRFETAFHLTIPLCRRVYGVPYDWIERYGIIRYGFHGSSHEYISVRTLSLAPDARRIISIHLGGSSSVCAILDGKSVANSFGTTLQSGLMHNNRVGDMDAYSVLRLLEKGLSTEEIAELLANNSGLKGLSGISNDMRVLLEAASGGDERAKLTIDAFCDNIAGYIGAYSVYLSGLDAIVFTGGIGYRSADIRRLAVGKLAHMGVKISDDKNECGSADRIVSEDNSAIKVITIKTNEELVIARHVIQHLKPKE